MERVSNPNDLRSLLAARRTSGRTVGLVPTMGNIHDGHLSLVALARSRADLIVASVFVNPLQFGANDDFARYPRTLSQDIEKLQTSGVDLVYTPTVESVYPCGYPPSVSVCLSGYLAETLEGAYRPGHFGGVLTVVQILFNQVDPDIAVFGEKDWQQLVVIRQMVEDLSRQIEIKGCPTVREPDGLAMSSRNQYLSSDEREVASNLYRSLMSVSSALKCGRRDFAALCAEQVDVLTPFGFQIQYLEVRRTNLQMPSARDRDFVVLAAGHLGGTRLIDGLYVDVNARGTER